MSFYFSYYDGDGNQLGGELLAIDNSDGDEYEPQFTPDNTSSIGPLMFFYGESAQRWPVAVQWVREVEEPWRRGFGIGLKLASRTHIVGVWVRGRSGAVPSPDMFGSISTTELARSAKEPKGF